MVLDLARFRFDYTEGTRYLPVVPALDRSGLAPGEDGSLMLCVLESAWEQFIRHVPIANVSEAGGCAIDLDADAGDSSGAYHAVAPLLRAAVSGASATVQLVFGPGEAWALTSEQLPHTVLHIPETLYVPLIASNSVLATMGDIYSSPVTLARAMYGRQWPDIWLEMAIQLASWWEEEGVQQQYGA